MASYQIPGYPGQPGAPAAPPQGYPGPAVALPPGPQAGGQPPPGFAHPNPPQGNPAAPPPGHPGAYAPQPPQGPPPGGAYAPQPPQGAPQGAPQVDWLGPRTMKDPPLPLGKHLALIEKMHNPARTSDAAVVRFSVVQSQTAAPGTIGSKYYNLDFSQKIVSGYDLNSYHKRDVAELVAAAEGYQNTTAASEAYGGPDGLMARMKQVAFGIAEPGVYAGKYVWVEVGYQPKPKNGPQKTDPATGMPYLNQVLSAYVP